jgi:hypothetical protein
MKDEELIERFENCTLPDHDDTLRSEMARKVFVFPDKLSTCQSA